MMNKIRANSSPELLPPSNASESHDFTNLEGVAATVKLLLKLIEDHKEACAKEKNDSRRMLRVAGIMTILENIKNRIQTSQSFGKQKPTPELRRSDSDLQKPAIPRDKKINETIDEILKLKKELSASQAACKSLEIMCSSLGKEKEIMASELARKVHELNEMEELVSDLRAQNEKLRAKVQDHADANKGKKSNLGGIEHLTQATANAALQERNKMLSEQVLRSIDGCRSAKRKLRDAQEENNAIRATMKEMGSEVGVGLDRIREFKQRMVAATGAERESVNIEREIAKLEQIFECFEMKVSKHGLKKGECVKPKGHINSCKPVLA